MRRSEKGRSMVEMLGVLAIIGVLSVGGIYGYTVAMNKYKANEVAQAMNMYGVMALSANGGTGNANLTANQAGVADSNNKVQDCTLSITSLSNNVVTVNADCGQSAVAPALAQLLKQTTEIKFSVTNQTVAS